MWVSLKGGWRIEDSFFSPDYENETYLLSKFRSKKYEKYKTYGKVWRRALK